MESVETMYLKKVRTFLSAMFICGTLMLSGCGTMNANDDFIFGKNRIHCAGETITIVTPFELISEGKQVDLGNRNATRVNAEGHNNNLQILVTGNAVSENYNVEKLSGDAVNVLKNNPSLSDLKTKENTVTVGNKEGKLLTFTFTESGNGHKTALTVKEYIFSGKNTVWRVIYQYRSGDQLGKELADRVAGQITSGSEF